MERWRPPSVFLAAFAAFVAGGVVVFLAPGVIGMPITLKRVASGGPILRLPFTSGYVIKAAMAGWTTAALARFRPHSLRLRQ